jgi:uncharacterized protein
MTSEQVTEQGTQIRLHPDASAFLAYAEPWLRSAEMENAMALQSAQFARTNDSQFQKPLYWATVEHDGRIIGCAFRTPPFRLGITTLPLAAIPALVASVAGIYRTLSGVAGAEPAASELARLWSSARGIGWSVRSRQRLLTHKALVPTGTPPRGRLRAATAQDSTLARQWGDAFATDSGLPGLNGQLCADLIRNRWLWLWDDGTPRCMLGVLRETRDAAAIGILYTPPEHRDLGFATAAVSAFSLQLLERGVTQSYFCLDPSNPAADSICWRLGYVVVQETADIDFVPRSQAR